MLRGASLYHAKVYHAMLCCVVSSNTFEASSKAGNYLEISQGGAIHKEGGAEGKRQNPLVHHGVLHAKHWVNTLL